MRLAQHVAGTVHVDEMLDGMTPGEFDEWCAKDEIEPIGHATHMLGLIAWYIHGYLAKDNKCKPEDFMPWLKHQDTPRASVQQTRQLLSQIAGGLRSA